jgi:hypothetical protein
MGTNHPMAKGINQSTTTGGTDGVLLCIPVIVVAVEANDI